MKMVIQLLFLEIMANIKLFLNPPSMPHLILLAFDPYYYLGISAILIKLQAYQDLMATLHI